MDCSNMQWINNEGLSRIIFLLFLGQLVSFLTALMAFTASITASLGVDTPLTLSFFNYLALALVYGGILIYRRQNLLVSWYWYLLLGFVDVQGNYLINKAYQYSSITSVTLLNCWTVPWVIILTWLLLRTRYSMCQFFGAAVCVASVGVVVLSDARVGVGGGSRPLLGDALVTAGTCFFAMSSVGEEFCVKRKDQVEVVAMIGVFGMLVSVCEVAALERNDLKSANWSTEIILAFAGYAVASFLFYTFVPMVLKISGSTLLNLSLLTSDMWAVVIRIFFYKQKVSSLFLLLCIHFIPIWIPALPAFTDATHPQPHVFTSKYSTCANAGKVGIIKVNWLYYLSFALVVVGLVIYSRSERDTAAEDEDGEQNKQCRLLDEESMDFLK